MQEGVSNPASDYYDYQDVRDDRINTFFSLNQGATKLFEPS
jgi:hypothetical protein